MYLKSVSWIVISTAIFGLNLIITEYLKEYQNLGYYTYLVKTVFFQYSVCILALL